MKSSRKLFFRTVFGLTLATLASGVFGQTAYFKISTSAVNDMALPGTNGFWYSDSAFTNQINVPKGTHDYYADLKEYSAVYAYDKSGSGKISGSVWSSGALTKTGGYVWTKDFTVNLTNTDTKNDGDSNYFMVIGGDATLRTTNNLTLNIGNSGTNTYSAQKLLFWNGAKATIGSDLIINNLTPQKSSGEILKIGVQFAEGTTAGGASTMTVNGRLIMAAEKTGESQTYGMADAYFGLKTVTITQNVVLNNNMIDFYHRNSTASKGSQDVSLQTRNLGGIGVAIGTASDDRGYKGNIQSTQDGNLWLNLTNTAGFEYAGSFAQKDDGASKINISMNGSTTGKQILRINSISDYSSAFVTLTAANIANLKVQNGELNLGMMSSKKVETLSMEGGRFSTTGLTVGSTTGTLNVDTLSWKDGSIIIDSVSASDFDLLNVGGAFNKSDDMLNMTFEFSVTASELSKFDGSFLEFVFLKFDSTNIVDINQFTVKTSDDVNAILSWVKEGEINKGLSVRLEAVPEPAQTAVLIALLAMAAVFYMRRK